ncbi:MAG: AAA family ATPase [Salipiger marinus]|uniref:AAA family ATPase n=1 Tax=Salipiger marinus TaxID=555512 RepID=UPI004058BB53
MKPDFVKTRNYMRFLGAMSDLEMRGSAECRLIIVDGPPGLGKTTILSLWADDEDCTYLRAKTDWDPYWMLGEMLTSMGIMNPPRGHQQRFNACLAALAERSRDAAVVQRQFVVVIDEADHVSTKGKLVDTIRDLTDISGVPFILVGMGKIRDNLTRYPQTASRISRYVRFEPATVEEVTEFLAAKCEVPVAADLAAFVHRATGGFNREILEAIKSIERFGLRNPPASTDGLTLREMAGQHLTNDRKSGRPIHVPGVTK